MKKKPNFLLMKKCFKDLKYLSKLPLKKQRYLLKRADKCLLIALSEISLNCLNGNIPLSNCQFKKLKRHKKILRLLAKKNLSLNKRKKYLQKGGFLNLLLPPALSLLSSILGSIITKKIKNE